MLKTIRLGVGFFIIFVSLNCSYVAAEGEVETSLAAPISDNLSGAKDIVVIFQDELLNVMKQGKALSFQDRYKQLEAAIIKSHDLTKIARIVVGKEWKKLSDVQKISLVDVFSQLSISAYAHNFKEFSDESFQYISEDETARGGVIVHTLFVLPNDKDVKFDYMLKKKADSWRIINIIANGVSDLALKRSEYTSVLKREGFDSLIAKIKEKIDNYAKQ
ncbi:MAG: ABC transporter substrate-binding protein [Methylococcaceae bacterium]